MEVRGRHVPTLTLTLHTRPAHLTRVRPLWLQRVGAHREGGPQAGQVAHGGGVEREMVRRGTGTWRAQKLTWRRGCAQVGEVQRAGVE